MEIKTTTEPLWYTDITKLTNDKAIVACLTRQGSTTQYLTTQLHDPPTIQVLKQYWQHPHPDEASTLKISTKTKAWVREVIIKGQQSIYMYGRSLFPAETIADTQGQRLLQLEDKPLGSLLFKDPRLERSPFCYAKLTPDHYEWQATIATLPSSLPLTKTLWARRSVLYWFKCSLLLTELFLTLF